MPEGPSIVILKELLAPYIGKTVLVATGNAKIDMTLLERKKIMDIKSYGKQLLISFKGFYIRIHLLMFGTYRINERKAIHPRLSLSFKKGEINFYTCSVRLLEGDVNNSYNWEHDVMANEWDPEKAEKAIMQLPEESVADLLMNQDIFAGVGNIIKNEVLFITRIHPKTLGGDLPQKKLKELIREASSYSFNFYTWKKEYTLKKHWLIYFKWTCPRCKVRIKREYLGKGKRMTYYCENCQVLY
jgi:endonuclease-8